jgi:subtilase family serine protease
LETRCVLSATLGASAQEVTPLLKSLTAVASPAATTLALPAGLSPAQVRAAYGFNNISFGGATGDGKGQTIAIVDAYNDPNIVSDLKKFDQTFGIADPPSFKVVNQTGGTKLPQNDQGWSSEIALDVEWAHAIAPGANILLVEANSSYTSDLNKALDYARGAPGVVVVSNSWGGSEYSTEKSDDVHFTTPSGHPGVTFTVAAGDNGAPAEYPSSSPDVLSVGGSTLRRTSSGAWSSESVWSGGGGGTSTYEGLPSFQSGLGISNRGTPDVSYDANPNTGFAVYDSYGDTGWDVFGGTSAGAPQWAALIAIADQGRALAGKGSLSNAQAALYTLPRADFHDITSGSNGYSATTGYDVASGLGSPIANLVIRDLVAFGGSTSFTQSAATSTVSQGGWWWWWGGGFILFDAAPAGGGTMAGGATMEGGATQSIGSAGDIAAPIGKSTASVDAAMLAGLSTASQLADGTAQSVLGADPPDSYAETTFLHHTKRLTTDSDASSATADAFFASLEGGSTANRLF